VDQVLQESASRARIPNIKSRLSSEVIMCVDPHLIQVQYSHSPKRHVIFGKASENDLLMDPSVLRGAAIFNTPTQSSRMAHKLEQLNPNVQTVNILA